MHTHETCKHELKYCEQCDVVYCNECKKEWVKQKAYDYTPYVAPITYTGGAVTWCSNTTHCCK